ncbi:MAG: 3-oxoacyl-[acyl-carrier protein] reductase [Blastocatellia bacterium]|jgi:3-oxoacyl-[acyl-carrier protein] reductase|nr:3-oxoacyl-[acyl-carrier protein] reductase [Blastocatellia bacterium]
MSMNGMQLKGRVALVTGGSRGIGRATCERLAEQGADVVVNYFRDEANALETVAAAKKHGVRAMALKADVSQTAEAEALTRGTIEAFGRLDFLVCNAGVWDGAPVESLSEELWDRVIDINLKGTWAVCRAAVPQMKRQGGGRIVIVSSTAGQRGEAGYSNYAASKGGQISFTKSLASELAAHQINVNAVAPGWVETEMNTGVFANPEKKAAIERGIPLGRIASADDIALPIVFLCSEWARHLTGEVLNVNGGSVLCG